MPRIINAKIKIIKHSDRKICRETDRVLKKLTHQLLTPRLIKAIVIFTTKSALKVMTLIKHLTSAVIPRKAVNYSTI